MDMEGWHSPTEKIATSISSCGTIDIAVDDVDDDNDVSSVTRLLAEY